MDKLNLIIVKNPFDRLNRDFTTMEMKGQTLLELRDLHFPAEVEVAVTLNGSLVPVDKLSDIILQKNDYITLVPVVSGGGGGNKSIIRAVLMIVVMVVAWQIAPYLAGEGATAGAISTWAAVVTMVGGMLINALIPDKAPQRETSTTYAWNPNTLQKEGIVCPRFYGRNKLHGNIIDAYTETVLKKQYLYLLLSFGIGPYYGGGDAKLEINNRSYSDYNGVSVYARSGTISQEAIGIFDKTVVQLTPNQLITFADHSASGYVYRTVGSTFDALQIELAFPYGLGTLSDAGNGETSAFQVKVTVEVRKVGDPNWTGISTQGYNLAYEMFPNNNFWTLGKYVSLDLVQAGETIDYWYEYERGSNINRDHYTGELGADPQYSWKWINVEGGDVDGEDWVTAITSGQVTTLTGNTSSSITFDLFKMEGLPHGQYDIRVKRLTADADSWKTLNKVYLTGVKEITYGAFQYPRHGLVGIKALATNQLSGSLDVALTADWAYVFVWDGTYWKVQYNNNPAWVAWDILSQPVFHLEQGIHAGAILCTGTIIPSTEGSPGTGAWYYNLDIDGTTYTSWMVERYDGYKPASIDLNKFKEWADYCDEVVPDGKKYAHLTTATLGSEDTIYMANDGTGDFDPAGSGYIFDVNLVVDAFTWTGKSGTTLTGCSGVTSHPVGSVVVPVASVEKRHSFNGGFDTEITVWDAVMTVCVAGRAAPYWFGTTITLTIDKPDIPVNMVTVGNIGINSFEETYLPMEDRCAEIEIDFVNAESSFTRDVYTVINDQIKTKTNRVSLQLTGTTKASEAWRAGNYRLNCNQHLLKTAKLGLDVDSITFTLGDIINVQHDVPVWGYGGRIVSATSATVTLDREVVIEAGKTYILLIRLSNDSVITRTVTNTSGTHTTLTLAEAYDPVPQQFDIYSFGETNKAVKPFRVIWMRPGEDHTATLSMIEYNPSIYAGDYRIPAKATPNYSALATIKDVTDLTLTAKKTLTAGGAPLWSLYMSFKLPVNSQTIWDHAIVWYTVNGGSWLIASEKWTQTYIEVPGVAADTTYRVKLQSVDKNGNKTALASAPSAEVTTTKVLSSIEQLTISGLCLADNAEFTGSDISVKWNAISSLTDNTSAGAEPSGAGSTATDAGLNFKDYEVTITETTGGSLRRVVYTTEPKYTYTHALNVTDGTGAKRAVNIAVKARDKSFNYSKGATLSVNNPAPAAVTDVAMGATTRKFELSFTKSSDTDTTGYKVFAATTQGFTPTDIPSFLGGNLVYDGSQNMFSVPVAVDVNTTYYIRIAAYDKFGQTLTYDNNGTPVKHFLCDGMVISSEYSVTVPTYDTTDITPPAVPTGLAYTSGVDTLGQANTSWLRFTWNANTENDFGYYVLRARKAGDATNTYAEYTVQIGASSYRVGGVPYSGDQYYVSIKGVDVNGNGSDWSSEITVSLGGDTTAPSTPTGLTVSGGMKKLIVKFSANTETDLAGYELHVSLNNGFTPDASTLKAKGLNTYYEVEGASATTYYVKVRAYDWSNNFSNYTSQASAATQLVTTGDVADFSMGASKMFTSTILLSGDSWTDNTPSAGYISWNTHTLYYQGTAYTMLQANTSSKYIYWAGPGNPAGAYYSVASSPPSLTDSQFMIATNISGTHDLAWNAIANQVIGNAYIADLSAAKINAGVLYIGNGTNVNSSFGGDNAGNRDGNTYWYNGTTEIGRIGVAPSSSVAYFSQSSKNGVCGASGGSLNGIWGVNNSTGYGVYGGCSGSGIGVGGVSSSGYGVYGSSSSSVGIYGSGTTGIKGTGSNIGVEGVVSGAGTAVYGSSGGSGTGVYAASFTGYALWSAGLTRIDGLIQIGTFNQKAFATTITCVANIPIYDTAGSLLGYVPILTGGSYV